MGESGRFDLLGALVAKNSKSTAPGLQNPEGPARTHSAKGEGSFFSDIFANHDASGATPLAALGSRGEIIRPPAQAEQTIKFATEDRLLPERTVSGALSEESPPVQSLAQSQVAPPGDLRRQTHEIFDHSGYRGDRAIFHEETITVTPLRTEDAAPKIHDVDFGAIASFIRNEGAPAGARYFDIKQNRDALPAANAKTAFSINGHGVSEKADATTSTANPYLKNGALAPANINDRPAAHYSKAPFYDSSVRRIDSFTAPVESASVKKDVAQTVSFKINEKNLTKSANSTGQIIAGSEKGFEEAALATRKHDTALPDARLSTVKHTARSAGASLSTIKIGTRPDEVITSVSPYDVRPEGGTPLAEGGDHRVAALATAPAAAPQTSVGLSGAPQLSPNPKNTAIGEAVDRPAIAPLSTVKLGHAPAGVFAAFPAVNDSGVGAVEMPARFQGADIEISQTVDRGSDARPPLAALFSQASALSVRNTPFASVLANSSPLSGASDGAVPIETDAALEAAALGQAASARTSGAASSLVPISAQPHAPMTGVLPQIQAAITTRNGQESVEVRLDPPELGRIRIEFNVDSSGTLKAVLGAERPETLDHLRRNIADLQQQLTQAGFGSVTFEFRSGGGKQFASGRPDSDYGSIEKLSEASATANQRTVYLSLRENARLDLLV